MKKETKQQVSHTPGTWVVEFDTEISFLIGAPNVTVAMSNMTDVDEGRLSTEEMQANGRLIAAAPEMLEALKDMLNPFINMPYPENVGEHTTFNFGYTKEVIERAKAVINKVTNQ